MKVYSGHPAVNIQHPSCPARHHSSSLVTVGRPLDRQLVTRRLPSRVKAQENSVRAAKLYLTAFGDLSQEEGLIGQLQERHDSGLAIRLV